MAKTKAEEKKDCFVIMPISDPEGYSAGHFKCVYEDLLGPAIEEAGYNPKRADDDKSSSMIQVNIIRDIIEAPMAICDLSTRNPNVLFELGIRQAFDLPVVLVQEVGTPRIFDINTIKTIDYQPSLVYRDVMVDRKSITDAIKATESGNGINSIIKLLELTNKADIPQNDISSVDKTNMLLMMLTDQMQGLSEEIKKMKQKDDYNVSADIRMNISLNEIIKVYKVLETSTVSMRVYELAKQLNMDSEKIIQIAVASGINVKNHMALLRVHDYEKMKAYIEQKLLS